MYWKNRETVLFYLLTAQRIIHFITVQIEFQLQKVFVQNLIRILLRDGVKVFIFLTVILELQQIIKKLVVFLCVLKMTTFMFFVAILDYLILLFIADFLKNISALFPEQERLQRCLKFQLPQKNGNSLPLLNSHFYRKKSRIFQN